MADNANFGSLAPLPEVLSRGLITVSTFGVVSFCCSTTLFFYLSCRLLAWMTKSGPNPPVNQFFVLIYNLLLADIQQASAFLLNITALSKNAIIADSRICHVQGWFISTGDLASSAFICAIAVHTFSSVVKEYRISNRIFYCCICAVWTFVYLMAAIGPILHGREFFARASAWCWINEAYEIERLWLHYFWIVTFMLSTILIYLVIFLYLRHKSSIMATSYSTPSPQIEFSYTQLNSATPLMVLYPFIYTICTAPLAAGCISALAGHSLSLAYFCVAGTMIACNGWLDVLLYASTRADIVFSECRPSEETGLETFAFMGRVGRLAGLGTVTTIKAGNKSRKDLSLRMGLSLSRTPSRGGPSMKGLAVGLGGGGSRTDSRENLYGLKRTNIEVKGEVTVSIDQLDHELGRPNQSSHRSGKSWDQRSGKSTTSLNGDELSGNVKSWMSL